MKRMLNDEQIFELQELLEQVSISSGVVNFNKIHTDELTISDNGKWNGSGIFIDDLTMIKDNGEEPAPLLPLSVANAGKVLAVGEDGESVDAVEKGTKLYHHLITLENDNGYIEFISSTDIDYSDYQDIADLFITGVHMIFENTATGSGTILSIDSFEIYYFDKDFILTNPIQKFTIGTIAIDSDTITPL